MKNIQGIHPIFKVKFLKINCLRFLIFFEILIARKDLSELSSNRSLQFALFLRCSCKYFLSGGTAIIILNNVTSYSQMHIFVMWNDWVNIILKRRYVRHLNFYAAV